MQSTKTYNHIAGQNKQRIETMSDGVFAIAITLLVLDIHVPFSKAISSETDLINAFCQLTPKLLTYFLSFMTLGIFWTGHTAQFSFIEKSDRHLNWICLFFLLFISVLPFTTAFLGEFIEFKFAIGIYWANIFLLGFILFIQWEYVVRNKYISVETSQYNVVVLAIRKRIVQAQILYAFGALLCFVNTYLSICVIIIIQLNYALALFTKNISRNTQPK